MLRPADKPIYNTGKGIRLIFLNLEAREFLTLIGNERDDQVTRLLPRERLLFFINGFQSDPQVDVIYLVKQVDRDTMETL